MAQAQQPLCHPLSSPQRAIWFDQLLHPQVPLYNVGGYTRINGTVDPAVVESGVNLLVQRYDALRTVLVLTPEEMPMQRFLESLSVALPYHDFSKKENSSKAAVAWMEQHFVEPFVLYEKPLFRYALLKVSENRYYFWFVYHHLIIDGWGAALINKALGDIYTTLLDSRKPSISAPSYWYFVENDRAYVESERYEVHRQYWLEKYQTLPEPLFSPRYVNQSTEQVSPSERRVLSLSRSFYNDLIGLAKSCQATTFHLILGALYAYFTRTEQKEEFVVGLPVLNRQSAAFKETVGLFSGISVSKFAFGTSLSFKALLQSIGRELKQNYRYQRWPISELNRKLGLHQVGRRQLYDISLSYEKHDHSTSFGDSPGLTKTLVHGYEQTPLMIYVREFSDDEDVDIDFVYNLAYFKSEEIERIQSHFMLILEYVLGHIDESICMIPLFTEAEQQEFLTWNQTRADYPKDQTIIDLFQAQVEKTPEHIAVIFDDQQLTYKQLNTKANQLAHYLQSLGVKSEMLVGICLERSLEMIIGLLGILKAGGAYVPLDPTYPKTRLKYIMEDAQLAVLLTRADLKEQLPDIAVQTLCLDQEMRSLSHWCSDNPSPGICPENLAYTIYTSGSTGKPKGTLIAHRGLVNYLTWCIKAYEVADGLGAPVHSPIGFDATITSLFSPLLVGQKILLASVGQEIDAACTAIRSYDNFSLVKLTPAHLEILAPLLPSEELRGKTRFLILGGEALTSQSLRFWRTHAPETRIINEYGPTETVVGCCVYEVGADTPLEGTVPIGGPIANTQLYVLDAYFQRLPVGVSGELYIGGVGLARGYLNRPGLTAEKFIANPFAEAPGSRLYKTGDLARYLADGTIAFVGRSDNQVKVRGYRIELGEIEAVLSQHPEVRETAVVVHERAATDKRLVAYLVPQHEGALEQEALRLFLRERLPEYMLPSAWVTLEALPLTPNGKVDRQALAQLVVSRERSEAPFVAARTPEEALLAGIWAELLDVERVGVHDNFFALGGDSIITIQVVSRAKQAGLSLIPRQLFQHQTIADLAAVAKMGLSRPASEQGLVTGLVPLTPIQRWFFERELPEAHHFNQAVLLKVSPKLQPDQLEPIVSHLLQHHDVLRLRVSSTLLDDVQRGEVEQWITDDCSLITANGSLIAVKDLSALTEEQQQIALEATAAELQASLDLGEGPLWRVAWFQMGHGQPNRLFWVIHHLAVDGVSWRILLDDFTTAHQQLTRGEAIVLPPKTSSFQHWARRLVEYADSAALHAKLEAWLTEPNWQETPLPVDYAADPSANTVGSAAQVTVSLSEDQTRALLNDVPKAYRTQINDVLLTALVQSFAQWTEEAVLLIDLEGHGREELFEEVDLSRTVGWFTSVFPVRLDLRGGAGEEPGAALKTIKEQLRGIPQHGIDYGVLRYLNAEAAARLQALPRAQVSFNYLGQFQQFAKEPLLGLAFEVSGATLGALNPRSYLLDINSLITEGRLHIFWSYSDRYHCRSTIERVAQSFISNLQALIVHCQLPEAWGYTSSDFPLAQLSQATLDKLVGRQRQQLEDIYPLSPMQEGILFHSLYAPESGVYLQQLCITLAGDLQQALFRQAWQHVVGRYAVLRTACVWEGLDKPLQMVLADIQLPWVEQDWRGLSPTEQEAQLATFLEIDRENRFDLTKAPLMRCTLLQVTDDRYDWVWSYHHLLMDGWSLAIIIKEVFSFYEALCQGQALNLPRPRPYRDYIAWLQQQGHAQAEAFWKAELKGFTAPTPLRVDRRADRAKEHYEEHTLSLGTELTGQLQALARVHHLTLNTLVQGAWGVLLSRYSGELDVVFGATVSGRPATLAGVETMVGVFINTLPVRVAGGSEDLLLPWLKQLHTQQVEREAYSYTPLVDIQTWSDVSGGVALFESLLVFENYPVDRSLSEGNSGSLTIGSVRVIEQTNYPLTLIAAIKAGTLGLHISYNSSRFEAATVSRMLGHVKMLLEGMIHHPETKRLGELALLTEAERHQLLSWNGTVSDDVLAKTVVEWFEDQVERTPEALAVVCENQTLTYGELNARANQLARYLQRLGVGPDVFVGICLERSLELVIGLVGILKAGGAYVPLDPAYPHARLAFMLHDATTPVLVTHSSLHAHLPETTAEVVCIDVEADVLSGLSATNVDAHAGLANVAYVMYTSGSTGQPKGVVVRHSNVTRLFTATEPWFHFKDKDVWTLFHSYAFDFSVWELWGALLYGGKLIVVPYFISRSPEAFYQLLGTHGVTVLNQTPSAFRQLIQVEEQQGMSEDLNLRFVIFGGEALEIQNLAPWFERHGDQRPQLVNMYGITETTVHVTYRPLTALDLNRSGSTIGMPIPDLQAYILDIHLQPTPIGVPGELYIGGAGLARGYLNRPELTQEKFVKNPFGNDPDSRLYKSGDVARYLPDGDIEYLGRSDNQVKVRGYRIELGEIEAVLSQHPEVRETAVVVHERAATDKRLVAYLVPQHEGALEQEALRLFLRERLPEYMLPSAWVTLEALPLTPNGKVDRQALAQLVVSRERSEAPFVAARTPEEALLAGIWAELLDVERVGVHDNFFALGGDSIITIQVISRAKQVGLSLTPKHLFQHPTIAELALVATTGLSRLAPEQGLVTGAVRLTPIQQWFFEQDVPQPHHFNQAFLLQVSAALEPEQLEPILSHLLRHHDALRLRFGVPRSVNGQRGEVEQWLSEDCSLSPASGELITLKDLSTLSAEAQQRALEATLAELHASLHLTDGPLWRVAWFDMGQGHPNRLFWVIHHLAVDGVSWRILLDDFTTAHQQLTRGEAIVLPPKTSSFQHWARRLVEYADSTAPGAELEVWASAVAWPVTPLPVDDAADASANTVGNTADVSVALSSDQTRALLNEVPQAYRTQINDVLLTALVQCFAQWTHEPMLVIDLEGHGREMLFDEVDLSRTVGWFTSIFPVVLDLRGVPVAEPGAALKTIKEQLRRIPQHGIGYGVLRYLNAEAAARLQALPRAQVSFNYLGQFQQFASAPLLGRAPEASGDAVSASTPRPHLLNINSLITEGQLQIAWSYSAKHHRRSTIERLAQSFIAALESLIAHCQSPEAGDYTPSDFPLAQLSQATLDKLLCPIAKNGIKS